MRHQHDLSGFSFGFREEAAQDLNDKPAWRDRIVVNDDHIERWLFDFRAHLGSNTPVNYANTAILIIPNQTHAGDSKPKVCYSEACDELKQ